MKTETEKLKARMDGAKAALEGRKLDANNYDENDDLHFEWLVGWTDTRMEMLKSRGQNDKMQTTPESKP
jgi:ribosome modulation factor